MDAREIRERLKARGLKQAELARYLDMQENKLSKALSGVRRFTVAEMDRIREFLAEHEEPSAVAVGSIPVIGQVAAGNWREAIQRPIGAIPKIDPSIPARAFALRVAGDSMEAIQCRPGAPGPLLEQPGA
jgi:repressor LexA